MKENHSVNKIRDEPRAIGNFFTIHVFTPDFIYTVNVFNYKTACKMCDDYASCIDVEQSVVTNGTTGEILYENGEDY